MNINHFGIVLKILSIRIQVYQALIDTFNYLYSLLEGSVLLDIKRLALTE
jgi:hypothetical protein